MADVCVKVAVRIRPLLPKETLHGDGVCVRVVPGSSQVMLGSDRGFSFHDAFGPEASQDEVYEQCVRPLLDTLLDGDNVTVFCYGQTGSGKTYTLDGGSLEEGGLTDRVAQDLFCLLDERREVLNYKLTFSYLELYMEELRDLLELPTMNKTLHIREDDRGNTVVVGAIEQPVRTAEDLLSALATGNALRRTSPTGMNDQSSRSHAIVTLHLHQRIQDPQTSARTKRTSKLHLVDLAGSERAGKTGNTGLRLKESVHINTGLLALGNVIHALTDPKRNPKHVPYRDAKLTRLLRDSLGGQAHTLMIACVSPSERNLTETLSVLQFASRVRHVRNHPLSSSADQNENTAQWDPKEAKVGELELRIRTLKELLKNSQNELQKERCKVGDGGKRKESVCSSAQRIPEFAELAQAAGALLAQVAPSVSDSFLQRRLEKWQETLTMKINSCQSRGEDEEEELKYSEEVLKLRCKETLTLAEEMIREKEAEVQQLQQKMDKLLLDCSVHLRELEEEREHNQIKMEQLVNQQIAMDRLRGVRPTVLGTRANCNASESSERRAQSVPLSGPSVGPRPLRKIHSSPPLLSLERVMASFKIRGRLLVDALDRKQEVYSPFTEQKNHESSPYKEEEEEEAEFQCKMGFRRSLNRTWTSRQKRLTERNTSSTAQQEAEEANGQQTKPRPLNKTRSSVKRRIHDLSVAIRMKEELIQEMDRTDKLSKAVDRQGSRSETGGALARISLQNQQVRAQTYHSLQHMLQQRAALQASHTHEGQEAEQHQVKVSTNRRNKEEDPGEQSAVVAWLDQVEEQVLRRRAEQRELEEEQRTREEVQERREACLQQRERLQDKRLRSSQVLSQDLLRVSVQLERLEQQIQSSETGRSKGVSVEELRAEREGLEQRRRALEQQLQDNQALTPEEEQSLVELEEAIEKLDAELEFKSQSIQRKEERLCKSEPEPPSFSHRRSTDTNIKTVRRRLRELSPPEITELLVTYFNKVVRLREAERVLLWRCEELELQSSEQGGALRAMEEHMQRLALDTDRRLVQQHRENQRQIQPLLRQLTEMASNGELQELQERLQHLEKELFFYKSSSRNLKKQLREINSSMTSTDNFLNPKKPNTNGSEVPSTTHIPTTHTRINTTMTTPPQSDQVSLQNSTPSASYHLPESQNSAMHNQIPLKQSSDSPQSSRSGDKLTPVRVHRRDLRQISLPRLQASRSSTRGQQSIVDASTEPMMEDSIEVTRKNDT